MTKPSHIDESGRASMVDISGKARTEREASAEAHLVMKPETLQALCRGEGRKGDVFSTARIAGIMAAKKTSDLIPLCHPLSLGHIAIDFALDERRGRVRIVSSAKTSGRTGVEMEALMAAAVASLTIYDMAKSLEKTIRIENLRLLSKSGGKSGEFLADG